MLRNFSSLATIIKAHVYSVTHCQLPKPQHTYTMRAFRVTSGPEGGVVAMHNNVYLISVTQCHFSDI